MKCAACDYEKLGLGDVLIPEKRTYYKSGPKINRLKEVSPATTKYQDRDPEKEGFRQLLPDLNYSYKTGSWGGNCQVTLYMCPQCGTVKAN